MGTYREGKSTHYVLTAITNKCATALVPDALPLAPLYVNLTLDPVFQWTFTSWTNNELIIFSFWFCWANEISHIFLPWATGSSQIYLGCASGWLEFSKVQFISQRFPDHLVRGWLPCLIYFIVISFFSFLYLYFFSLVLFIF